MIVSYDVYKTNADLEDLGVVFRSISRDIAESKMGKLFIEGSYSTDYVVINRGTLELVSMAFTPETIRIRNECQG